MTLQGVMYQVLFILAVFSGPEGINNHERKKICMGMMEKGFSILISVICF
jgi:hypothetical protein